MSSRSSRAEYFPKPGAMQKVIAALLSEAPGLSLSAARNAPVGDTKFGVFRMCFSLPRAGGKAKTGLAWRRPAGFPILQESGGADGLRSFWYPGRQVPWRRL